MHIHICVYVSRHVYMCMCIYIYVNMFTYIYIYIYVSVCPRSMSLKNMTLAHIGIFFPEGIQAFDWILLRPSTARTRSSSSSRQEISQDKLRS